MFLTLPIFGPLFQRRSRLLGFTRTLGTLLSSGVPVDALEVVAKTAGNVVVEESIMYVRARIAGEEHGRTPRRAEGLPSMVVQMLGVGEQTSALDTMLNKGRRLLRRGRCCQIAALTSFSRPIMMVGISRRVRNRIDRDVPAAYSASPARIKAD